MKYIYVYIFNSVSEHQDDQYQYVTEKLRVKGHLQLQLFRCGVFDVRTNQMESIVIVPEQQKLKDLESS